MASHTDRARDLLSRMTLAEKTAQLMSAWLRIDEAGGYTLKDLTGFNLKDSDADARQALVHGIGQVTRPLGTHSLPARAGVRALNAIQKQLVEHTRLGIPALSHEECLAGVMASGATLFPAGINLAATWDPRLVHAVADAIGVELASLGARQGLAPVLDVSRDVRWGRTEETLGEDPYLAGCLATAYVQGLQGPDRRVLATLKHFLGHSFSEGGRNHAPVHVGERELSDVFMLPFEMAVRVGQAGSVMPAYHDIDGEPCTSSRRYITELLRGRWGFDGIVVSDYEAIALLYQHHRVAADEAEASALALQAGMDMELPGANCFSRGIEEALRRGILSMDDVNAAVTRVLVEKSRLGLFERPYADEQGVMLNVAPHRAAAREAAAKSVTLLVNDGVLPLAPGKTIALIGPLADERRAMLSGYSFPIHVSPAEGVPTLRAALEKRLPGGKLLYSPGCEILRPGGRPAPVFPGELEKRREPPRDNVSQDTGAIQEAVRVASRADQVILAVGDIAGLFMSGTVGEGSDAASLRLPGVQQELLDSLLALGRPLVIVLISGRPYDLQDGYARANAVVQAWLPGQEGAEALADVVLGVREPGGRLPVSVPRKAGAMPYFYNHKMKAAGTPVQKDFGARFPFGYGLGYTRFEYEGFAAESRDVPVDGEIVVSGVVRNVGARAGDEVVQLYVRDVMARVVRPVKELKAFRRCTVEPGKAVRITFRIPVDMLSYTSQGVERVVEPGAFELMAGASSEDIRHRETVNVVGALRHLPVDWRMQSESEVAPA